MRASKEEQCRRLVDGATGDELVELGVGIIARGLFRISEAQGAKAAANAADAASSATTAMHLDFYRLAEASVAQKAPLL